jgi:hypothetical protein
VGPAELAYGGVELFGLLEVADVAAVGDHDELGVRDPQTSSQAVTEA